MASLNTIADTTNTTKARDARSAPHQRRKRERLHSLLHEVMTPENTTRLMLASELNWLVVASFAYSVVTRLRDEETDRR
ncbi:hypothetical protein TKK_0005553 [Trichogramma kaykai]